jgi:hypothetical protein
MKPVIQKWMILMAVAAAPAGAAVFTAAGANPAAIETSVNAFRAALGANNGVGAPAASGRREVNWDGVPNSFAAPNNMPGNFFNSNSPRGIVFSTPGTGFGVSSTAASGVPVRFGNIDASYTDEFQTFSAERLFTVIGSNQLQIDFFVPGTTTPATVFGFGAIFSDVELASTTIYSVFLGDGSSGGQFAVPVSGDGGLSFLGLTDPNRYSRIVIQFGNVAMGAGVVDNPQDLVDVVAMDDFIYGEPLAARAEVPEPSTGALAAAGACLLAVLRRKTHLS